MKVNGLRHGLLDGPYWEGKFRVYKNKKHRQSSDYQCFLPVGVTELKPTLYDLFKVK